MSNLRISVAALAISAIMTAPAFAACQKINFSDVGWTDITATTAATTLVLDALGYETDISVLSVPVTYTAMKSKDIDVFLGNWKATCVPTSTMARSKACGSTLKAPNTPWQCRARPMTPG